MKCSVDFVLLTYDKYLSSCTRMTYSSPGFAAIKCTALGNPILLEEMSTAIVRWREQFRKLDSDKKGNYMIRDSSIIIILNKTVRTI